MLKFDVDDDDEEEEVHDLLNTNPKSYDELLRAYPLDEVVRVKGKRNKSFAQMADEIAKFFNGRRDQTLEPLNNGGEATLLWEEVARKFSSSLTDFHNRATKIVVHESRTRSQQNGWIVDDLALFNRELLTAITAGGDEQIEGAILQKYSSLILDLVARRFGLNQTYLFSNEGMEFKKREPHSSTNINFSEILELSEISDNKNGLCKVFVMCSVLYMAAVGNFNPFYFRELKHWLTVKAEITTPKFEDQLLVLLLMELRRKVFPVNNSGLQLFVTELSDLMNRGIDNTTRFLYSGELSRRDYYQELLDQGFPEPLVDSKITVYASPLLKQMTYTTEALEILNYCTLRAWEGALAIHNDR